MKIKGSVVSTNMKRPDFHQTDERKSDYILNNPLPILKAEDEGKCLLVKDGKIVPVAEKLTPAEKDEIIKALIASFPVYNGEVGQYE
jgi:hypothetical protein